MAAKISEKFEKIRDEFCDDRKLCFVSNLKKAPNHEFGFCLSTFNNGIMSVHGVDMSYNYQGKLYDIDLSKVENIKTSSFMLNAYIQFTYNNEKFKFGDFPGTKETVKMFLNECEKRD